MSTRGTGVGSVLLPGADLPIHRVVVQGVAVFVHHVLSVPLMGLPLCFEVVPGLITVFPLLDLFGRRLVLSLGLTMGCELCRCLPTG